MSFRFDDLRGRTVVLTGATRGIGRALAPGLAEQGLHLILVGRDPAVLQEVVAEVRGGGGAAEGVVCDLSRPDSRREASVRIADLAPVVDGLIHNAAIDPRMPLERMSLDFFRLVMATNVEPAVDLTRDLLPNLKRSQAGRVILMGSIVFAAGPGLLSAYVASKGAIVGLTRSLAHELGPANITVNCVHPGAIGIEKTTEMYTSEIEKALLSWQSISRSLFPRDLLGPICLLLSDAGGAISGQTLSVDGGFMHPIAEPELQRTMVKD